MTYSKPRAAVQAAIAAVTLIAPYAVRADTTLEEVVVTAQRRSERLQDVPVAVTALSASDLTDRGVRQAGDIAATVPNLLLNSPYGPEAQPTFTLRGVTTQDYSQNQSSPIAMYVDEVYKPVGSVQALQTFDLDRVEVLRGPQGTLYGKNATGGAVSFFSKNPSLTQTEGYATAGFGNYSAYSFDGAVSTPIIDNVLGVRAAMLYEKRDGWVHSIVPGVEPLNGVDALAGRLSFLYKPTDTLTASLKLSATRSGGTPYGAHALNVDPAYYAGTISWFDNGAKYAVHKDIRNDSAALKIEWLATEHTSLTSVTGFDFGRWYTKSDDGGLPVTLRLDDPNTYFSTTNDFSEELRLASRDSGPVSWLAGLYYGRESTHATVEYHFFDSYDLGYFALPNGTPLYGFDEYNNFDQIKDSRAVFLNADFALNPAFTLRAGARYTKDKVSINNFYALEGGPLAPGPTGYSPDGGVMAYWTQTIGSTPATFANYQQGTAPQAPLLDLSQDNNNFSYRVGVDWRPTQGVLTYFTVSEGYRGAAFNGQAFNFPEEANFAQPEKLTSYELGLKMDLWDRRGTFNAAVFHYDYRNQQFLDSFTLPSGTGSGFHTVNAPKSRVDGAEFELHAKATDDLEIRAALGLMNSKYVDLTLHAASRVCCTGNKLIQAPDYNGSLGIDWRFAKLASGDLRLMVDGNYYAKQYFDAYNTERIAQGAYGVANARVSYRSAATRGFDAGVWIKNISNTKYLAYGLNQNDPDTGAIGFDYALVGEPRTYGADLTYRF
jgi:outer membrane receptor protein involved in Fe transport